MTKQFFKGYLTALVNPTLMSMALRVALVVGSILFTINHAAALVQGQMTQGRWISAVLTYCVPYAVSIHGQYVSQQRRAATKVTQMPLTVSDKELIQNGHR
ncbi:nitrate/nitrite transporter NrtS [Oscillatoria sp. CS-180]|uniref:nitrate/nitrite transporter NrtS n=1 Tax=Oscillatoria sp. CS-180 TaxID=3021720 RepID=UPI00232C12D4|nr:nitrate/nitrite transporter NrtS [Oscillatoria sp. CS-180]MDB9528329.1 nitrate/nitrite transporter NrtS [Oscillatoria sp. CS-180]